MFNQFYIGTLKKYAEFSGTATRQEFWMYFLFNALVAMGVSVVAGIIGILWLGTVYNLAVLVPTLAIGARRLHDIGKSGWWQLIGIIPLVGLIVLVIFWAKPAKSSAA